MLTNAIDGFKNGGDERFMRMVRRTIRTFVLLNLGMVDMVSAQQAIVGRVDDYSDGKGLIISRDIVTGDTYTWGKIDENGTISIPLSEGFLTDIKKMAAKAQKKVPSGFKLTFPTVGDTFTCQFGELAFENPGALVSGLPDLLLTDRKKKAQHGRVYAVNNPAIATWLQQNETGNIELGYYLMFYFAAEKASATGKCMITTHTGLGNETYEKRRHFDVELEIGWNIVQYQIDTVFTSKDGRVFPQQVNVKRLDTLPGDLQWVRVK